MLEELWSSRDDASLKDFLAAAREGAMVPALCAVEGLGPSGSQAAEGLLGQWAARLATRTLRDGPAWNADALADVLGRQEGFQGDDETYYDVANCRLSQVLTRRRGMPILLSIVWMEVGRRAGVEVSGVGLPGHFIARVGGPSGVLVDPFGGGRRLTLADCKRIVENVSEGKTEWRDEFLDESTGGEILERVLQNLLHAFARVEDVAGQYRTATFLSGLCPGSAERLLQRGVAADAIGARDLARSIFEDVVTRFPESPEAEQAGEVLLRGGDEASFVH